MKRLGTVIVFAFVLLAFTAPALAENEKLPNILTFTLDSPKAEAFTFTSAKSGTEKEIVMPAPAICGANGMMIPAKALSDLAGVDVYTEGSTWSGYLLNVHIVGKVGKPIELYLFGRKLLPNLLPGAVTVERDGHLYVPVRVLQFLGGFGFIVDEPPCLKVTALRW